MNFHCISPLGPVRALRLAAAAASICVAGALIGGGPVSAAKTTSSGVLTVVSGCVDNVFSYNFTIGNPGGGVDATFVVSWNVGSSVQSPTEFVVPAKAAIPFYLQLNEGFASFVHVVSVNNDPVIDSLFEIVADCIADEAVPPAVTVPPTTVAPTSVPPTAVAPTTVAPTTVSPVGAVGQFVPLPSTGSSDGPVAVVAFGLFVTGLVLVRVTRRAV